MSSVTLLRCGGQARSNKNRSETYAIAAQNKNNMIVTEYDKNLPPVIIALLLKGIAISIKIGIAQIKEARILPILIKIGFAKTVGDFASSFILSISITQLYAVVISVATLMSRKNHHLLVEGTSGFANESNQEEALPAVSDILFETAYSLNNHKRRGITPTQCSIMFAVLNRKHRIYKFLFLRNISHLKIKQFCIF